MRSIPPLILSLLLASLLPAQTGENDPVLARFQEGAALMERGDNPGALAIFNELLAANPQASNIWFFRAQAKLNLNDFAGAEADCDRLLALEPKAAMAHVVRGTARALGKKLAAARADFDQALALDPGNVDALTSRAWFHVQEEKWAEAIADYSTVLEIEPAHPRARGDRGAVEMMRDAYSLALADTHATVRKNPEDGTARLRLAWLKFFRQDWAGAAAEATAVASAAGTLPLVRTDAIVCLGVAQFAAGDAAAAAKTLEQLDVPVTDDNVMERVMLHTALVRTGQPGLDWAKVSATWPEWSRAVARYMMGEMSDADLLTLGLQAPQTGTGKRRAAESLFCLGLKHLLEGDKSTARKHFEAAQRMSPPARYVRTLASFESQRLGGKTLPVPVMDVDPALLRQAEEGDGAAQWQVAERLLAREKSSSAGAGGHGLAWVHRAAENGSLEAQGHLHDLHRQKGDGLGYALAYLWQKRITESAIELHGRGGAEGQRRALAALDRTARVGDPAALKFLLPVWKQGQYQLTDREYARNFLQFGAENEPDYEIGAYLGKELLPQFSSGLVEPNESVGLSMLGHAAEKGLIFAAADTLRRYYERQLQRPNLHETGVDEEYRAALDESLLLCALSGEPRQTLQAIEQLTGFDQPGRGKMKRLFNPAAPDDVDWDARDVLIQCLAVLRLHQNDRAFAQAITWARTVERALARHYPDISEEIARSAVRHRTSRDKRWRPASAANKSSP